MKSSNKVSISLLTAAIIACSVLMACQAEPLNTSKATDYGADPSYFVQDGAIFQGSQRIQLRGINWFGLEGQDHKLHGLWSGRSLEDFVDQVRSLGFNALRVPVSPQTFDYGMPGNDGYASPVAQLRRLLEYTQSHSMHVLIDLHTCSKDNGSTNKPGPALESCSFYSIDRWLADLQVIATVAGDYNNVVGIDLFNEPYGFTWTYWAELAGRAYEVISRVNSKTLIFVEGVGNASYFGSEGAFWGENLTEAGLIKPNIPKHKLVYSPHVYGPSVAAQTYFENKAFPSNMPAIWDSHFGYLKAEGYAIAVGEFGGRYQGQDRVWQDAFVDYMLARQIGDFFYWSLNPNSGDTGGLLQDDWRTVDDGKMNLLRRLMTP